MSWERDKISAPPTKIISPITDEQTSHFWCPWYWGEFDCMVLWSYHSYGSAMIFRLWDLVLYNLQLPTKLIVVKMGDEAWFIDVILKVLLYIINDAGLNPNVCRDSSQSKETLQQNCEGLTLTCSEIGLDLLSWSAESMPWKIHSITDAGGGQSKYYYRKIIYILSSK